MLRFVLVLFASLRAALYSRTDLVIENLALRQQLAVLAHTGRRGPSWLQIPSARRRCKTRHVIELLRFVSGLATDLVRRRVELVAENALLRQQLIAAERKVAGRVRWTPWQRFTIVLAARVAPAWREATLLIQPATILRWHRVRFRAFWRRRSRRSGRPPTTRASLIREMAGRNPWSAERARYLTR